MRYSLDLSLHHSRLSRVKRNEFQHGRLRCRLLGISPPKVGVPLWPPVLYSRTIRACFGQYWNCSLHMDHHCHIPESGLRHETSLPSWVSRKAHQWVVPRNYHSWWEWCMPASTALLLPRLDERATAVDPAPAVH